MKLKLLKEAKVKAKKYELGEKISIDKKEIKSLVLGSLVEYNGVKARIVFIGDDHVTAVVEKLL